MDETKTYPATRLGHWIIGESGGPEICDDLIAWAQWIERAERHVALDLLTAPDGREVCVSTVFLGTDHSFARNVCRAVLWETMILAPGGVDLYDYQERYTSIADAKAGHMKALALAMSRGCVERAQEEP